MLLSSSVRVASLNDLSSTTIYTATVTTGVTDWPAFTWIITTLEPLQQDNDTIERAVLSTNPKMTLLVWLLTAQFHLSFSEGLNPTTFGFVF